MPIHHGHTGLRAWQKPLLPFTSAKTALGCTYDQIQTKKLRWAAWLVPDAKGYMMG